MNTIDQIKPGDKVIVAVKKKTEIWEAVDINGTILFKDQHGTYHAKFRMENMKWEKIDADN